MSFEHWNALIKSVKEQKYKQPPPQKAYGSSKEVNRIEQKQIQKV